jgi:hypothetical protein
MKGEPMILHIDTDSGSIEVTEPQDCKRLSAIVTGNGGLTKTLGSFGNADVDGEHLWISISQLRTVAAPAGDDGWSSQYDGMIRYATSKGWVDKSAQRVRVHIDRQAC